MLQLNIGGPTIYVYAIQQMIYIFIKSIPFKYDWVLLNDQQLLKMLIFDNY